MTRGAPSASLAARGTWLWPARSAPLAVLGAIGCGWAATQPRALLAAAALLALGATAVLTARAFGVVVGLLVLAVLNALPVVDLTAFAIVGAFAPQDLFVIGLLAALGARAIAARGRRAPRRAGTLTIVAGGALAAWWMVTWARSVLLDDVPPLQAALFGRDFLYFALLLPLTVAGLERRDLLPLVATLAAGGALTAVGHVLLVLGGVDAGPLVHPLALGAASGLTRIYSAANNLLIALVPIGLGAVILGETLRLRAAGGVLLALAGAATTLLQVRAVYFGLFVGTLVIGLVCLLAPRPIAGALRRRGAAMVGAGVVLMAAVLTAAPAGAGDLLAAVAARALSGVRDVSADAGTFAYRQRLTDVLLAHIGGTWPIGLGFLHPSAVYVADLPVGSIRNGDLGFTNVVATMGGVGAVLLYLPVVGVLARIVASLLDARIDLARAWLPFGVAVWTVSVLLGSLTLVTLFGTPGLVLTATLLGAAVVSHDAS